MLAGAAPDGDQGGGGWHHGKPSAGAGVDDAAAGCSGRASPGLLAMLINNRNPCKRKLSQGHNHALLRPAQPVAGCNNSHAGVLITYNPSLPRWAAAQAAQGANNYTV